MTMIFGVPLAVLSGQLLIGIINGAFYALLSLGLAVIFGLLKIINFAHGEIFMVGAFSGLAALTVFHLPFAVAIIIAMIVSAVFGVVIERCAYRPLRGAPRLAALITAIGVSLLLQNVGVMVLGAAPRGYPEAIAAEPIPWIEDSLTLVVTKQQVVILALTGVILLLLPVSLALLLGQVRWGPFRIVLALGLAGIGLGCLYWSGSKAGWLIALVLFGAWLLHFPFSTKLKIGLAGAAMLIGLAGFAVKYADYFDKGATSVGARFGYWSAAAKTTALVRATNVDWRRLFHRAIGFMSSPSRNRSRMMPT